MRRQNRQVLLLLDNAPSHPKDVNVTNVKLVFIPANIVIYSQLLEEYLELHNKIPAESDNEDKLPEENEASSSIDKCVFSTEKIWQQKRFKKT